MSFPCYIIYISRLLPEVLDQINHLPPHQSIFSIYPHALLYQLLRFVPQTIHPSNHDSLISIPLFHTIPVNLKKLRQIKLSPRLIIYSFSVLILMIAWGTLNLEIIRYIFFYLHFPLRPDIRAKHTDQHPWVNAYCENEHKGYEEDYGNCIRSTCDYGWFIGHVIVANIK